MNSMNSMNYNHMNSINSMDYMNYILYELLYELLYKVYELYEVYEVSVKPRGFLFSSQVYSEVQSGKIPKWCWPLAAHGLYYASRVLEDPGALVQLKKMVILVDFMVISW